MMDSDYDEIEICLKCTERGLERCLCVYEEALSKIVKAAVEAGIAGYEKKKNKKSSKKKAPKKKSATTKADAATQTGDRSDENN